MRCRSALAPTFVGILAIAAATVSSAQSTAPPSVAELMTKAATGDAAAQFALGMAYHDGKGVNANDSVAAEWIRKSADQGYAAAQNELGVLYRMGEGVERNKEEGVRWLRLAARQGNATAMFQPRYRLLQRRWGQHQRRRGLPLVPDGQGIRRCGY
jgi:TPR repeat protein